MNYNPIISLIINKSKPKNATWKTYQQIVIISISKQTNSIYDNKASMYRIKKV